MNSQDFLQITLGVGFIILVSCIIFITFYFVKVLKSFRDLLDDADNIAMGIKNGIKLKALAALPALLIALISKTIRKRR